MSNDVMNILVLGDSLCRGVIYSETKGRYVFTKDSFANIIQNKINANVYNTSKFGCTIKHAQQIINRDFKKIDPDIVFIEFGGNDCDYKWDEVAQNPEMPHEPNTPFDLFYDSLTSMVEFIQAAGKIPMLMNLPPLHAEHYLNWISGGDPRKKQVLHDWLGGSDAIYWWHERYSGAIDDIAKKMNVHCIDVRTSFLINDPFRKFICIDGIHPNIEGHFLIAKVIDEYIKLNLKPILAAG